MKPLRTCDDGDMYRGSLEIGREIISKWRWKNNKTKEDGTNTLGYY
jgi:hypothetical protein